MVAIRTGGTIESDRGRHRSSVLDDDLLSSTGGEDPAEGVVDIRGTLDDDIRSKESTEPVQLVAAQQLQPRGRLRKNLAEPLCNSACVLGTDDAGRKSSGSFGLDGEIVNGWESRFIATIFALKEALDERFVPPPGDTF